MRWITEKEILDNPNIIYIFGDNLIKKGYGGQAKICRKKPNCVGIPTKRLPTMNKNAFFSDKKTEIQAVIKSLKLIVKLKKEGKKLVFFPNIGQGYAKLPEKAPKTNLIINSFIKKMRQ